jgi:RimJ/RimL family protein N-acetyltransferase
MCETETLETERLRLRPLDSSDLDDFAALCADPEVARHLVGRGVLNRIQSWQQLAFQMGHRQMRGYGLWAVVERGTGHFAGTIGFADPEGWPGFELAWTLARRFWGRGYATEGARAALDYAFRTLKRDRVISLISPANRPSIRVAERLGQALAGRADLYGREMLLYAIDRWPEMPSPGSALRPGSAHPPRPRGEAGTLRMDLLSCRTATLLNGQP